jgi:hypothetical protein
MVGEDVVESSSFFNGVTAEWTHQFIWPEKPFLMNALNNMHYGQAAQLRAHWREAFRLMAESCEPLIECRIDVDHHTQTRRSVDVAACMPAYKAALDGVVAAGVLEDDGPHIVRRVTFHAPQYVGRDALILTITGCAA